MDWFTYLEFAAPFLPWKAAGKFVLTHTASLSFGLAAFLTSKTLKGDTAMARSQMKQQMWLDYAIAHPFMLPIWVWVLGYIFITFDPAGGWFLLIPTLLTGAWLWEYFPSLIRILEAYSLQTSAQEEGKEVLPCPGLAKT